MPTCEKCGGEYWIDIHQCAPKWDALIVGHDDEDDYESTRAHSPEWAAQKYAEENFSNCDYPDEMEIWIKKPEDKEWEFKYKVTIEIEPIFYTTLIEEDKQ